MAAIFSRARTLVRSDEALAGLRGNDGTYPAFLPASGIALLCVLLGAAVVVAEWNALFVGLALIACVFILHDFRIGVVLLIILMPFSYSQMFPRAIGGVIGLNPVNLLLIGTFASYLLHAMSSQRIARFLPRPLLWLYIAPFLIAGILGSRHVGKIPLLFFITETVNFVDAAGYLRDMVVKPLFLVAFALLVGVAVARTETTEKFLAPMLISMWIMSLLVIIYFLMSGTSLGQIASTREFLTRLGMHANELGRMYVIAYALLLYTWAGTKDHGIKLVLVATMVVIGVAVVLTFSRGSFAGFVLVSALFLASRRNISGTLFGALVAVGVLLLLPDAVYERVTHGFGGGANAISAGRIDGIWMPLIPDLLRSPIYGNGIGSMLWSEAVRSGRAPAVTHPHSAYLQALLDMGVVGLVLVCAYFVHLWKEFRRLGANLDLRPGERSLFQGAAAGLVVFLAMALVDGSLTPRPEQIFLWLAAGMMYGRRAGNGAG